MVYLFIIVILIIVDLQIVALYCHDRDLFEKTKDEKYLLSAKRWFAGSAYGVIVTLMSTFIMAIHFVHTFFNSFRADF